MTDIRREGDKYGLVESGHNDKWLLPAKYDSLRFEVIGSSRWNGKCGEHGDYVLWRVIADNRYGLIVDEDVWEAGSGCHVLLEPIYTNLEVEKAPDDSYSVRADGSSGRIQYSEWTDPLMPDKERRRREEERILREKEQKRRWDDGAPERERAEMERRKAIQTKRKATDRCIMCGRQLTLFQYILRKSQHPGCVEFRDDPPDLRELARRLDWVNR
jgi:hypothetical protein